jgi:hypothetical protein
MIIGLMTANYPMLFFLLAYLIAVPLLTNGLNLIGEPILTILYQLPLIGIPFNCSATTHFEPGFPTCSVICAGKLVSYV